MKYLTQIIWSNASTITKHEKLSDNDNNLSNNTSFEKYFTLEMLTRVPNRTKIEKLKIGKIGNKCSQSKEDRYFSAVEH